MKAKAHLDYIVFGKKPDDIDNRGRQDISSILLGFHYMLNMQGQTYAHDSCDDERITDR